MEKQADLENIHTVSDGKGELIAIVRRDPVSKKHLVYLCKEANSIDIIEELVGQKVTRKDVLTEANVEEKTFQNPKTSTNKMALPDL